MPLLDFNFKEPKQGMKMRYLVILFTLFLNGCVVSNIQKNLAPDESLHNQVGYIVGSFLYSERNSAARLAIEIINIETREEFLIELRRPKVFSNIEVYPFTPGQYRLTHFVRLSSIGELIHKYEIVVKELIEPFSLNEGHAVYIGHYDGKTTRDIISILFAGPMFANNDTHATKIYTVDKLTVQSALDEKYPNLKGLVLESPFSIESITQQDENRPIGNQYRPKREVD